MPDWTIIAGIAAVISAFAAVVSALVAVWIFYQKKSDDRSKVIKPFMTQFRADFEGITKNFPIKGNYQSLSDYVGYFQGIKSINEQIKKQGLDTTFQKEAPNIKPKVDLISTKLSRVFQEAEEQTKGSVGISPNNPTRQAMGERILLDEELVKIANETYPLVVGWMNKHP